MSGRGVAPAAIGPGVGVLPAEMSNGRKDATVAILEKSMLKEVE